MNKKILFSVVVLASAVFFAGVVWALDEMEPNDAPVGANSFSIGTSLRGGLPGSWGGDGVIPAQDYWQFNAQAGRVYRFQAELQNCSFLSQIDLIMQLKDSGDNNASSPVDSAGYCGTETLEWTAPSSGTYYLVLYSYETSALVNYSVSTSDIGTSDTPTPTPTGTNTPLPTSTRTPTPSPNVSGAENGWQDYR
jgi:hypothetical protein